MLIKAKVVYSLVNDELYDLVKNLDFQRDLIPLMSDKDRAKYNILMDRSIRTAMKIVDTSNYVHIAGTQDRVLFFELDYIYTGEELNIARIIDEDGQFFVEIKE